MTEPVHNDVLDFSDFDLDLPEKRDFPPIPEGSYLVRVREATYEVSRSGYPMYVLVLEIVQGEHKGRRLWLRRVVSEKTSYFVRKDMKALRIMPPKEKLKADGVARLVAREALGAMVAAEVGLEIDGERERNVVRGLARPDSVEADRDYAFLVDESEL